MAKVKAYDSHYTTGLEDLVLNVNQVAVGNFKPHDLYMIKFEGEIKGPILATDLKAFIEANHEYYTKAEVCRLDLYKREDQKGWGLVYEQPFFQRRKPSLITQEENELEAYEDLYVLKNGQKLGPYTFAELSKQLKKHEFLFTDFLSFDGGHTWKKMHEIKDLDRRTGEGEHLPAKPKTEILNNFELHAENKDESLIKDLAALGNNKEIQKNKVVELSEIKKVNEVKTDPELLRKGLYFVGAFVLVFFFSWYLKEKKANTKNLREENSRFEQSSQTENGAQEFRNRNGTQNGPRNNNDSASIKMNEQGAVKRQRPSALKRRSFRESNAYKQNERQMLDDATVTDDSSDNYQFDDGNDPVEQDPIRSQLDKETIDPDSDSDRSPAADYEEEVYADGEENSTQDSIDDGEY